MKKVELTVPISMVEVWEKNLKTRATSKAGYNRTKKQIEKLGFYGRLLCFEQGGRYYVMGGRTRYFILKERGDEEILIEVVKPKSEAEKMEYCLSHNDHSGSWLEMELLEETYQFKDQIQFENYGVDLSQPVDMNKLIRGVGPDPNEKKPQDPKEEEKTTCPSCGHQW